jgi:hypothetical protein
MANCPSCSLVYSAYLNCVLHQVNITNMLVESTLMGWGKIPMRTFVLMSRLVYVFEMPSKIACFRCCMVHGPLKLRTKHGGDNSRSLWRSGFQAKCFSRIQRGRKIMHTQKILAQLLSSPRSYSLPKYITYTVVKSQFLGLQLSSQILSVNI